MLGEILTFFRFPVSAHMTFSDTQLWFSSVQFVTHCDSKAKVCFTFQHQTVLLRGAEVVTVD